MGKDEIQAKRALIKGYIMQLVRNELEPDEEMEILAELNKELDELCEELEKVTHSKDLWYRIAEKRKEEGDNLKKEEKDVW